MVSLTKFMTSVIEDLKQEGRYSTAYIYNYALCAFTACQGGGEIFFNALTRRSLRRFQQYLEDHQRSYNTISTYIRALRAIYNRAVDRELIPGEMRLFSGLKTGIASERKLALTAQQMNTLLCEPKEKEMPQPIQHAQDILKLMLHLQGMPFVDLAHLRKGDLKGDMLICYRQKTGTELHIKMMPEAMRLIDRYRNTDERSHYLLRFLSGHFTGEQAFKEYRDTLRKLNMSLGKLAHIQNMKGTRISSYTARHTWATLAKYCQIPEEVISEGLGHSSLEVTRTYLKSFEWQELFKANNAIINYIKTGQKINWGMA